MAISPDPFTQVYDALYAALQAHVPLAKLVKLGNTINLGTGSKTDPLKAVVQDGDLPELVLLAGGGSANLYSTSTGHRDTELYRLLITTGEIRLDTSDHKALFPVKWECIRAIGKLDVNLGLSFVTAADIGEMPDTIADKELNRGKAGWSCILVISVRFHFSRSEISED